MSFIFDAFNDEIGSGMDSVLTPFSSFKDALCGAQVRWPRAGVRNDQGRAARHVQADGPHQED